MSPSRKATWKNEVVNVQAILSKIRPGMNIFSNTGVSEPKTLAKGLRQRKPRF